MSAPKIRRPIAAGRDGSFSRHARERLVYDAGLLGEQLAVLIENETDFDANACVLMEVAQTIVEQAEMIRTLAVMAARDEGSSWAEVGVFLDMSKQAAHQRYGGRIA